jgi:glycosyltransferase involved in cell wall biosynthesis
MEHPVPGSASPAPPTVSVIVPTRNSIRTLGACLSSIRAQTYPRIELIVVDNKSSDGTVQLAKGLADQVVDWGPERTAQRNRGAVLAQGSFLLFIDSDMVLSPSVVADCLSATAMTAAPAVVIPETSTGVGFWAKCRALERACYTGDNLIEAARFIDQRSFELVGGYDEQLIGGDDWDLSQRVARGAHLPRTESVIIHDEGRIVLRRWLAKKAYYARSFSSYHAKHGGIAVRQANLIFRSSFLKNWRRLALHPVLALGLFSLKSMELTASAWGFLTSPRKAGGPR